MNRFTQVERRVFCGQHWAALCFWLHLLAWTPSSYHLPLLFLSMHLPSLKSALDLHVYLDVYWLFFSFLVICSYIYLDMYWLFLIFWPYSPYICIFGVLNRFGQFVIQLVNFLCWLGLAAVFSALAWIWEKVRVTGISVFYFVARVLVYRRFNMCVHIVHGWYKQAHLPLRSFLVSCTLLSPHNSFSSNSISPLCFVVFYYFPLFLGMFTD